MKVLWLIALLASAGCYHAGLRGFAAEKTYWNTGGTILYGAVPCDARTEGERCQPLSSGYDKAKDATVRDAAQAEGRRQLKERADARCPRGWAVEEEGLPGWVKSAPTSQPMVVSATVVGGSAAVVMATATPDRDVTAIVYRCH